MTQRFYFDLTDGSVILIDEEGVEAASLDDMLETLQEILIELRIKHELPQSGEHWRMYIRNDHDDVLRVIPVC